MNRIVKKIIIRLITILSLSVFVLSCKSREDAGEISLSINNPVINHNQGSIFINVKSNKKWTLSLIQDDGKSVSWAKLGTLSGKGNMDIILSYSANNSGKSRAMTVFAKIANKENLLKITQLSSSKDISGNEVVSDATNPEWLELPIRNNKEYGFFYHMMNLDGKKVRNYSYYYDYKNFVSVWVAYPLYRSSLAKKVNRTNKWGYDPNFSRMKQSDVHKGFRNQYGLWLARGHQIPSGDRICTYKANVQTFYSTNMTPQIQEFNGGLWEKLESKVRTWAKQSDTLYVVTGCIVKGATKYAYDASGKKITMPVAYYKAVLRYMKNTTIGYNGYTGIGFYFEHSPHQGEQLSRSMAISIKDLEQKVGTKFFINLPAVIGQDNTMKIKSQNPQNVSWWWTR